MDDNIIINPNIKYDIKYQSQNARHTNPKIIKYTTLHFHSWGQLNSFISNSKAWYGHTSVLQVSTCMYMCTCILICGLHKYMYVIYTFVCILHLHVRFYSELTIIFNIVGNIN